MNNAANLLKTLIDCYEDGIKIEYIRFIVISLQLRQSEELQLSETKSTSLAHSFTCQMLGLVATFLHTFVALLICLVIPLNIALDCFTCVNYAFAHTLMH